MFDNRICVIGLVDGVIIVLRIVDIIIIYFYEFNIVFLEIIFNKLIIIWIIGIWKVKLVEKINIVIKLKYCLKD